MLMVTVRSMASSLASSGVLGSSLMFAMAAAPQPAPVDAGPPSAIEQALIERACTGTQSFGANGENANAQCLEARLLALRSEFGRDLSRLSTAERRKLDSTCSRFQTARGRETYLDCLQAELASLSARRNRGNVSAAAETVAAAATGSTPSDAASSSPLPAPSSSSSPLGWMIAILVVVAGAIAGVVFTVKSRQVRHTCRACNIPVPGPGDLCPTCRHDAAEALRRAAAERDERQRAQEEGERRQRDEAEAQRQQKERVEEEARVRRLEEVRLRDEARAREEATLQQEEDARRRQIEKLQPEPNSRCDEGESTFDPYAVLGLSSSATDEQVRAAFEAARSRYDPEQVAHLGDDVQTHYAAKSRAAERAYRMLAGEVDAPAAAAGRG
jgi:hypothetical protein